MEYSESALRKGGRILKSIHIVLCYFSAAFVNVSKALLCVWLLFKTCQLLLSKTNQTFFYPDCWVMPVSWVIFKVLGSFVGLYVSLMVEIMHLFTNSPACRIISLLV